MLRLSMSLSFSQNKKDVIIIIVHSSSIPPCCYKTQGDAKSMRIAKETSVCVCEWKPIVLLLTLIMVARDAS